ncbi:MAG: hypothetical protein GY729_06635 [Desulfobacteraceae bacterium]|nr:hypothetical protein [Desulfobacteraceae bacterium]
MKLKSILCVSAFFIGIFFTCQAHAHKVVIFAYVEKDMIHTESSFGGKRKVNQGKILVFNKKGELLHTGTTDDGGRYSFSITAGMTKGVLIKLKAGTGHQGQWKIPESDFIPSLETINAKKVEEKKQALEKEPSPVKIILGIVILFGLAFLIKIIKKRP